MRSISIARPLSIGMIAMGWTIAATAGDAAAPPPQATPDQPAAAMAPEVEKTSEHGFKIGLVEFNTQSREVRIPGLVNMNQGMIEFPVVHTNGRVHEAIFTTDALPLHFETAMRLLRYQPSKEVFPTHPGVDMNNPPPWDQWPDPVYAPAVPESHVQVLVSWKIDGKANEPVDIRTMMRRPVANPDGKDPGPNPPAPVRFDSVAPYWVFTSSTEKMTTQVESLGGCFVGIRTEAECVINTVAADAVHEAEWFAEMARIPAPGTAVTIHIRPAAATAPASAPTKPSTPTKPVPTSTPPTKP